MTKIIKPEFYHTKRGENMNTYGFEVAHGYEILKGYLKAESKEQAIEKIKKEEWDDIVDEFDVDELTEGYEVTDIWLIQ